MKTITRQQARRVIDQPDPKCPTGLRNRIILRLMYEAALRPSEIRALRRGDLDLAEGAITVQASGRRAGSQDGQRIVPLLSAALEDLRKWLRQHPGGDWLTPTLKGGSINVDYLRTMVRREAKAAGLEVQVNPRILRDTCGLELAAQFTTEEIAQLMGYADRRPAEKFRRAAASGMAERMRKRELQSPLPEKPTAAEVVKELLGDPAGRRALAKAVVAELGEEIREEMGDQRDRQAEGSRIVAQGPGRKAHPPSPVDETADGNGGAV